VEVKGFNGATPVTQSRSFTYDPRGFLIEERLPELATSEKGARANNQTIEAYPRRSLGQVPDTGVSEILRPSASSIA
jgi:hypothetical protein